MVVDFLGNFGLFIKFELLKFLIFLLKMFHFLFNQRNQAFEYLIFLGLRVDSPNQISDFTLVLFYFFNFEDLSMIGLDTTVLNKRDNTIL